MLPSSTSIILIPHIDNSYPLNRKRKWHAFCVAKFPAFDVRCSPLKDLTSVRRPYAAKQHVIPKSYKTLFDLGERNEIDKVLTSGTGDV